MTNIGVLFSELFNKQALYFNEPMKNHTSFKIGGPVEVLFLPNNKEDIIQGVKVCKENNIPYYIVGNCTNLLVRDKGFKGVIIKISKNINKIWKEDNNIIYAESGVFLSTLANFFLKEGLEGFEFASGIPGTLGGAIYMNAGAYNSEIKDVLLSCDVINERGKIKTLLNEEMKFGYRTSVAKLNNMIILGGRFKLNKGNKDDIKAKIINLNKQRSQKQPLDMPSAGSTFKRPDGFYAGKLIMDSGLKGFTIGGAQVSKKHCGFVVNTGNATSEDVIKLITHIKETVYKNYKIKLEQEVIIIGEE